MMDAHAEEFGWPTTSNPWGATVNDDEWRLWLPSAFPVESAVHMVDLAIEEPSITITWNDLPGFHLIAVDPDRAEWPDCIGAS